MGSYRQTFLYNLPALVTLLTGETRVHSDHTMSSTCSLGSEDVEERAPGGVYDGFRKMMVLHHVEDMQVLNSDMVIGLSVLLSNFEMMISTLTANLQVCFSNIASGFAPSTAFFLAPGQLTLLAPEYLLRRAIEARVRNGLPFRVCKEGCESNVKTNIRMLTGGWKVLVSWFRLTDDERIPLPISSVNKMYRLRNTHDLPMQFDLEEATELLGHHKVLLILMQIAIFAILSELDAMPPIRLFEAGKADTRDVVLPGGKKPFEGLTETISKHLYRSGWHMLTLPFECRFEFILAGKCPILLILCFDRLKHDIVNGARLSQARHEPAGLLFIHEQAVLKCSHEHILPQVIRKVKHVRLWAVAFHPHV